MWMEYQDEFIDPEGTTQKTFTRVLNLLRAIVDHGGNL